jgi:osmotically-inducible protein OsmY
MSVEVKRDAPLFRHVAAVAEARYRANSHRISCNADGGVLVLEGRLSTFYQKQLAPEIVANVEGVERVVNQIEVVGNAI